MNVYKQPTALLAGAPRDFPELREWWQYIAYGAACKIFADRLDTSSLQQVYPLMEEQKLLIQRRTLKQLTNQRAQTIYTDQQPLPLANFYPFN
jgi:hypothetical protein